MRRFTFCAAIVAAVSATGSAYGQAPRQTVPAAGATPVPRTAFIATMDSEFRQMDADKNNIVTRKEIEDYQRAVSILVAQRRHVIFFQRLDKDRNGSLSPAEFAALPMDLPKPNAQPVLAQTDANRDGQITLVEFRSGKLLNFDRMDIDKDGIVSVAEMRAGGLVK